MQIDPIIYTFLYLGFLTIIVRLLTTFIHEMGHAIPALLFTRKPVSAFIGSYGDETQSVRIRIGRLTIWIKYDLFLWQRGVCIANMNGISLKKQMIITLGGSLTSAFLAGIACIFTFAGDWHGFLKLFFVIALISSIFDLYYNLRPMKEKIQSAEGEALKNDGSILAELFRLRKYPDSYIRACGLYYENNFVDAAAIIQSAIDANTKFPEIYQLAIAVNYMANGLDKALELHQQYAARFELNANDLTMAGLIHYALGNPEESKKYHDAAVETDPLNAYVLSNRGDLFCSMKRFDDALADYNLALTHAPEEAIHYVNRGYIYLQTERLDEGLQDIEKAIAVNPAEPYAWRYLGLYHQYKGENEKALELYQKTKEMKPDMEGLDDLIARLQ